MASLSYNLVSSYQPTGTGALPGEAFLSTCSPQCSSPKIVLWQIVRVNVC